MRVRFSAVSSLLATAMSSRPPYIGGRNPYGRGFSGKVSDGSGINQFVSGDSHFQSVRDSNRSIGGFDLHSQPYNQRPPPQYDSRLPPSNFRPPQSSSHTPPYFNQNQSFRPPAPSYNQHLRQQFQTPPQHFQQNQQLRPQFQNQKPLDYRKWEYARICPHPDCDRFTVLSYNILADYLAVDHRSKLYFHIPRHMMDWEWRKRSILFELGLWSADILCFQEVDRFHDLEEELKVRGYCGTWKMRTGDPVDGCAIFWRFSRFKLLHEESIEFNKFGLRNNVAQICVLERINQNDKRVKSAVPASTEGPSKVVIGNIHVLYNPRRGEIKLGQVRALLDRAYAVSKLWDDAPVVLCGDFNCTPKSPLYNYISEQELELSGLPRDKISGQASAEIRSPRPFTPNLRTHTVNAPTMINHREGMHLIIPTDKSPHAPIMTDDRKVGQGETPSNMQKNSDLDSNNVNVPTERDLSVSHYISSVLPNSFGLCNDGGHNDEKRSDNDEAGVCNDKEDSDLHVEISGLDGSQDRHSVHFTKDAMHQLPTVHSHHEDMYTSLISAEQEDLNRESNVSCSELHQSNLCDKNESASSGRSKHTLSLSVTNERLPTSHEIKIPIVSTCNDCILDKNTEDIFHKVTESTENGTPGEDSTSFLSALHGDLHIPSGFSQISESNSSECKGLSDYVAISELDPGVNFNQVDGERTAYDPSVWTPMEIETATGCEDSTLMKSPLKLRSTYSEVEDSSGTRDSDGEPLVTSYNRCFLGTVDYIWRSEGLQTVRALAPIPKHAMQQTNGFPTRKWGSDHIALVSELAFTKDICN